MIDMKTSDYQKWIKLQQEAVAKNREDKSLHGKRFVGDRGYLHFDGRVGIKRADGSNETDPAYRLLTSSDAIANRSFFPFLREDQRVRKYRDKSPITSEGNARRHDQQFSTIKNRPIMYASHLDASVYSLYSSILSTHYEQLVLKQGLDNNVIAYRPVPLLGTGRNKSNINFAKELYDNIRNFGEDAGLLLLDVSGFFDNLNHKRLYEKWCLVLGESELPDDHKAIFKNISNFRYVFTHEAYQALNLDSKKLKLLRQDRKAVLCSPADFNKKIKKQNLIRKNKSGKGIPQGSPISGLLANMYMINFDIKVKALVEGLGGEYMRYSDDIAILLQPSKLIGVYEAVQTLIGDEGLKISTKKTECFVYQQTPGTFRNVIRQVEPKDTLNSKRYPQYLGFVFTENDMHIRGNTLARRFRGGKAFLLKNERWGYFSLAARKTGSEAMPAQVEGIRKKIKPVVSEAQNVRTKRNRERRGEVNSSKLSS
ncbi:MAG: RNA-directed polymerase [Patescibacteria group bacterium]|nr:RNA-directed polymerase [Patescibacteria group bacterium]